MAKDLQISFLLDFYGEMLTEKQREMRACPKSVTLLCGLRNTTPNISILPRWKKKWGILSKQPKSCARTKRGLAVSKIRNRPETRKDGGRFGF